MYINKCFYPSDCLKLKQSKHIQINNFLKFEIAEKIYACLKEETQWGLATRIGQHSKTYINESDFNKIEKNKIKRLQNNEFDDFQFVYNTYMIVTSYIEQRHPNHYLYEVLEWLNSQECLNYFKKLTSRESIVKINAQATRYMPGHYLNLHNDEDKNENRLYAYVLGFTKSWNPDWGGLLNILDANNKIVSTLIPSFNSLTVFEVPQNHFVSYVNQSAKEERLAITGWFLGK